MCVQIFAVVLSVNLFVNISSCQVAILQTIASVEPVSTHIVEGNSVPPGQYSLVNIVLPDKMY